MFNSLKISRLLFLVLSVSLLFTACKKDQLEETAPAVENVAPANGPSLFLQGSGGNDEPTETDCDALCFDFVYPVSLTMPDGSTQVANSDEELENIFETYFEANGEEVEEFPEFVFPISITVLETGETATVESEEDLIAVIEDCFEQYFEDCEDWEECFEIQFPVNVNMPDGSSQSAADEDALHDIFENWFEANEGDTTKCLKLLSPLPLF